MGFLPGLLLNQAMQQPYPRDDFADNFSKVVEEARQNGGVHNELGEIIPPVRFPGEDSLRPQDRYLPPPTGLESLPDEALLSDPKVQEFQRRLFEAQSQLTEDGKALLADPKRFLMELIFYQNQVSPIPVISKKNLNPAEMKAFARQFAKALSATDLMQARLNYFFETLQNLSQSHVSTEQKLQVIRDLRNECLKIDQFVDLPQADWDSTQFVGADIRDQVNRFLIVLLLVLEGNPELAQSSLKMELQVNLAIRTNDLDTFFPRDLFEEKFRKDFQDIIDQEQLRRKNLNILLAWQAYAREAYVASQDRVLSLGNGFLSWVNPFTNHQEGMDQHQAYWEVEKALLARVEKKLVNYETITIDEALAVIVIEEEDENNGTSEIYQRAHWLQAERSARLIEGEVRGHLIDYGKSLEANPDTTRRLFNETYHLQTTENCKAYAKTTYAMLAVYASLSFDMVNYKHAKELYDVVSSQETSPHEHLYYYTHRLKHLGPALLFYITPTSWGPRAAASTELSLQAMIHSEKWAKILSSGLSGITTLGVVAMIDWGDSILTSNPDNL